MKNSRKLGTAKARPNEAKSTIDSTDESDFFLVGNRGIEPLFRADDDYRRFIFSMFHSISPVTIRHLSRIITESSSGGFVIDEYIRSKIVAQRTIEVIAFSLLPQSFVLLLAEKKDGALALYLKRLQNSYAKFFNVKYTRVGHVFAQKFRKLLVEKSELPFSSAFVHRLPRVLPAFKKTAHHYPWGSFTDYTESNRFGSLLSHETVTAQFRSPKNYKEFTEKTSVKEEREIVPSAFRSLFMFPAALSPRRNTL